MLPAEVISGADVLKSPQASAVEGSIGGTVNLHTASPFDNPGLPWRSARRGQLTTTCRICTAASTPPSSSNTNEDQTLGFLLGGVHSDNNLRTDSLNAYNQNIYGPTDLPLRGRCRLACRSSATPCCITFGSIFDDKKRDALSGSLEWRPNETSSWRRTGCGLT